MQGRMQFYMLLAVLFGGGFRSAPEGAHDLRHNRMERYRRPNPLKLNPRRKPATEDPNYMIGAQDVLDISVWKEPEFTRTVPVRPDGKIRCPS